jgi:MFS family permease
MRERLIPELIRVNPVFRNFWTGEAISLFGDQVAMIALPLVAVLVLDASAAEMGYLTALGLLPNLLFSLHFGAWVDRIGHRRRMMIAADLGRAAAAATIPLAYALDELTMPQMYAVAFVTGTLSVLFFVSYSTLFVAVVPRDRYVEGNSILNGTRALSSMAGPSTGGILVQLLSAPLTVLVDAVSFLGSAVFLRRISPQEPPTASGEHAGITAGIRYIVREPVIRASLGATATVNLFNFMFFALFILYATRALRVEPGTLGVVLGAGAVGGVIGSLVTGRVSRRIGIGRACALGCILFPAPLLLVPLAGGPEPAVLAFLFLAEFGSGVGVMMLDITLGSIFAAVIPDDLRARVSGAYMMLNYGVRPLGALAGGVLAASIGLRPAVWIATAGACAGVLFLLPSPVMRMRELPGTGAVEHDAGEPLGVDVPA